MDTKPQTNYDLASKQKPSVGRIVHYLSLGSADGQFPAQCRAAIIAEVKDDDECCDIVVLNPKGIFFHESKHDEPIGVGIENDDGADGVYHKSTPGTWHWPERV